jgi:predicted Zn-ribbon and HTH transcriptional regulator
MKAKKKKKLTLECPECKTKLIVTDPAALECLVKDGFMVWVDRPTTIYAVRCPICTSGLLGSPFLVIVKD